MSAGKRTLIYSLLLILLLAAGVTVSCGISSTGNPGFIQARVPDRVASLMSGSIPGDSQPFTETNGTFFFCIPAGWQLDPSAIDESEAIIQNYIKDDADILPEGKILALAGIVDNDRYMPNAQVAVIPVERGARLEDVVNGIVGDYRENLKDFELFDCNVMELDGRKVGVLDYRVRLGDETTMYHQAQLITLKDRVGWLVTCTAPQESWNAGETDIYNVLKSFRLDRPSIKIIMPPETTITPETTPEIIPK